MSRYEKDWQKIVRMIICGYPARHARLNELKCQKITPGYSKTGARGKTQRKTESIALRQLPPAEQKKHDAVERALEITETMPDGKLRCKFVRLYYFREKRLTLLKISAILYVSERTLLRWNSDFKYTVKKELEAMGFIL